VGYRFESEEEADPEEPPASLGNLNPKQFEKRQELLAEFTPLTPDDQAKKERRSAVNAMRRDPNAPLTTRINEHYHVGIVDQQSKDNFELGDGHTPYNFEQRIPIDVEKARGIYPRASEDMLVKIAHATAQRTARQVLEEHFQSLVPKQETIWGPGAGGMTVPKGKVSKGVSGDLEAFITHRYQLQGDPKHEEEPGSFYADYASPGYSVTGFVASPVAPASPVVGRYIRSTRKDGNNTMRVGEATRQPGQINVGANPYR
jgi:hypothetical protein